MGKKEPKLLLNGRMRFCRTWRERSDTVICDRCLAVGHVIGECKLTLKCRWCGKDHASNEHKCPIIDWAAPKETACQHCRKECRLCGKKVHLTGCRECDVLKRRSTPPKYGNATPAEADNTSANGINDRSRNRFRHTNRGAEKNTC